jgi:predicted MFS family arabinose efflux permease
VWHEVRIALGLSVGAAIALGLSRFAYGLLLPAMRADLGWTYVEAGALNTANGAGYIAGALVAAWAASRWGMARAFLTGFSISVLILLLTAETASFVLLCALRIIGGVSTALTFILGAGLTAAICPAQEPRRRGTLVGLYVAGVGVGILLAGVAIPVILETGVRRWPVGWAALGLMGAAGLPLAWWAARQVAEPAGGSMALLKIHELRQMIPTLTGYMLFGAGYVGYMTFIIALLRNQGGTSEQMTWFWLALGLVATITTLLWGRVLGAFRNGRGPTLVYATSMLGTLPVLLSTGPAAMFTSAILFGGSFLAGPASITIVVQRQLPPSAWTAAISLLTVGFAFGQTVGPILAGAISDATGRIEAGFWVSVVLLGVAACVSLLQRPPASEDEAPKRTT